MDTSEQIDQARIYYIGPYSKKPPTPSVFIVIENKKSRPVRKTDLEYPALKAEYDARPTYSLSQADLPKNHNKTERYIGGSILHYWDASLPEDDEPRPDYGQFYSEKWQEETAALARGSKKRVIDILDLVFILAKEEAYSGILPELWNIYGFNDPVKVEQIGIISSGDNGKTWKEEDAFKTDQVHTRAMAWFWLLWRWTTECNCFFKWPGKILQHEKIKNRDKHAWYYIKLDDLRKCLNSISQNHEIDLPLPKLLYTSQEGEKKPQQSYFSKIGKIGGSYPKKNQYILQALVGFMQTNPKLNSMSNENVAMLFKKKFTNNNHKCVTVDRENWEVFSDGKRIYAEMQSNNIVKSIAYSTFKGTYVAEAKKAYVALQYPCNKK